MEKAFWVSLLRLLPCEPQFPFWKWAQTNVCFVYCSRELKMMRTRSNGCETNQPVVVCWNPLLEISCQVNCGLSHSPLLRLVPATLRQCALLTRSGHTLTGMFIFQCLFWRCSRFPLTDIKTAPPPSRFLITCPVSGQLCVRDVCQVTSDPDIS